MNKHASMAVMFKEKETGVEEKKTSTYKNLYSHLPLRLMGLNIERKWQHYTKTVNIPWYFASSMDVHFSALKSLIVVNTTQTRRNTGSSNVLWWVYLTLLALYQYKAFINCRFCFKPVHKKSCVCNPRVHTVNAKKELFCLLVFPRRHLNLNAS